jgi:hypothetical protein
MAVGGWGGVWAVRSWGERGDCLEIVVNRKPANRGVGSLLRVGVGGQVAFAVRLPDAGGHGGPNSAPLALPGRLWAIGAKGDQASTFAR